MGGFTLIFNLFSDILNPAPCLSSDWYVGRRHPSLNVPRNSQLQNMLDPTPGSNYGTIMLFCKQHAWDDRARLLPR